MDKILKMLELIKDCENSSKKNFDTNPKSEDEIDLTTGTVGEKHIKLINTVKKALWSFENADIVECDIELINDDMINTMWENIHVYSYDLENFFLDKFIFKLKKGKELYYEMYFYLEDNNIYLFIKDGAGKDFIGGSIIIKDGMFIPLGAVDERIYMPLMESHKKAGIPFDRQFIADRNIMNALLYIIAVNQMVQKDKEIITETSRRIEVSNKKKPGKKKKQPKRTVQVRYIKIDGEKIKKIREEHETQKREQYQRHISQWSKRGHWRHLANGEKVWIKPTVAHAQDKVGDKIKKIYKLK